MIIHRRSGRHVRTKPVDVFPFPTPGMISVVAAAESSRTDEPEDTNLRENRNMP